MAQKKLKDTASRPPPDPKKLKKWAFRRLADAQERAFQKLFIHSGIDERSIKVSREIIKLLDYKELDADTVRVLLAAKALGLMQSLRSGQRNAFLNDSSGRISGLIKKHNLGELFSNGEDGEGEVIDTIRKILAHHELAVEFFDHYHVLALVDFAKKEDADYKELYSEPIISGEYPRPVIFARLVDLATEPQKKIDLLGMGGNETEDRQLIELFRTMTAVYYPLADLIGQGLTLAVPIRRNATDLLEMLLSTKDEKHEDVLLYRKCKALHAYMEPAAEKVADELIRGGKLERIISDISKKLKVNVELASHTCNSEENYRIKGPSGMFWKEKLKGRPVEEQQDFLGTTIVVDGGFEDARNVADWLVIGLRQHLQLRKIDIKDSRRESGYKVPHVVFKIKKNGIEVPVEVQVRPEKTHQESKTGKFSHGLKVGRSFVNMDLVESLRPSFLAMENKYDTQRLRREGLLDKSEELESYTVQVYDEEERFLQKSLSYRTARAKKGEVVAGIIALAVGMDRAVKVLDKDGNELDLFENSPMEVFVKMRKGRGIDRGTCELLLNGKVVTKEAIEEIRAYKEKAPRKKRWGRK